MKPIALAIMLALSACATTPDSQPQPAVVETSKQTLGVLGWIGIMVVLPLAVMGVF